MRSELLENASDYGRKAVHSIEETTGKIPAEWFLVGAVGSIGVSLTLKLLGRSRDAEFVGHWAPTFLALGLFSKLLEHDRHTQAGG